MSENSAFSDSFCVFQSLFIIEGIETKYLLFEGRLIVGFWMFLNSFKNSIEFFSKLFENWFNEFLSKKGMGVWKNSLFKSGLFFGLFFNPGEMEL